MNDTVISVRELTKCFGDFTAVDRISFEVSRGEIFGFLGANGAGKTTAMRMLCGLSRPTSGSGRVAGCDIVRQGEQIKRHIGYMSQRFSLYDDLTVRENIRLFGGIYGLSRRETGMRSDDLLHRLDFVSEGNTPVGALPLGWKQKLAFAIATLHRPEGSTRQRPAAQPSSLRPITWTRRSTARGSRSWSTAASAHSTPPHV